MSEPTRQYPGTGSIEVIVGSMYSGKTEELIRRLRRAQIARQRVEIFKPHIDNRYASDAIVSHSEVRIPSRAVRTAADVLRHAHEAQVIGIDEGQFLGAGLVDVCQKLARMGKRVIVAGLDQDYLGQPFEPMPQLLAIADNRLFELSRLDVDRPPPSYTADLLRSLAQEGTELVFIVGADILPELPRWR